MQNSLKFFMAGDVMLGRLVDQIFPVHNHEPEEHLHAMHLIKHKNAEILNKITRLGHKFVWGDHLAAIQQCDVRIINLETSVTSNPERWPNKAFNYRMHPANLQCLKEANIDYCCLANNHTLDYGVKGMFDTIDSLNQSGVLWAGVGHNIDQAMKPAILNKNGVRIAFYSFADHPSMWASTSTSPGINYIDVDSYKPRDIERISHQFHQDRQQFRPDITIVSLHWGSNYCWHPPIPFQRFAHELIDSCGVDLIHGHSAHHIQGFEIYKGKPILYGCGDFIDDYAVDAEYRNNLGMAYYLNYDINKRKFTTMKLVPSKITLFSANKVQPNTEEYHWLSAKMTELCKPFGTRVELNTEFSIQ